jgi:hypothetical protein
MEINEFLRLARGEITGPIRVGRVPDSVKYALDSDTSAVWLSRDTLYKQFSRHGKLDATVYEALPYTLTHGDAFRLDGTRAGLVLDMRATTKYRFNAVVKCTKDRSEMYLISFYPLRKRDWLRISDKYNPIPRA